MLRLFGFEVLKNEPWMNRRGFTETSKAKQKKAGQQPAVTKKWVKKLVHDWRSVVSWLYVMVPVFGFKVLQGASNCGTNEEGSIALTCTCSTLPWSFEVDIESGQRKRNYIECRRALVVFGHHWYLALLERNSTKYRYGCWVFRL